MHTETRGDVLVVTDLQRLTADNVALFRDMIRATLTERHRTVEVDLSGVSTLDSEGVGALIAAHKRMRDRGGGLRVCRPQTFVSQMLHLLRLDQVIEIA